MKVLIFVVLLHFANSYEHPCEGVVTEWKVLIDPHKEECIRTSGVPVDLAHNLLTPNGFVDHPDLKCYITCLHKRIDIMRADDTYDTIVFPQKVAGVTDEILEKCNKRTEIILDPCQKAFDISICIRKDIYQNCIDKQHSKVL